MDSRVMSSYDFYDSDQGPPGSQPNSISQGACGNGWICEHRWSSILNMAQFANAVAGTGLENWQVKEGSLGFSRGNKGFFAMGDLNNVEFYTGLPDGDCCDIIHDCKQTSSTEFYLFKLVLETSKPSRGNSGNAGNKP